MREHFRRRNFIATAQANQAAAEKNSNRPKNNFTTELCVMQKAAQDRRG